MLISAVVYTGFRGWGGVPGAMWGVGVLFPLEKSENFAFFKKENFQNMLNTQ